MKKLAKFTSVGCYPLCYIPAKSGGVMCSTCATANPKEGPYEADVNWEDPELTCDCCGDRIESAYAEDQAPGEEPEVRS